MYRGKQNDWHAKGAKNGQDQMVLFNKELFLSAGGGGGYLDGKEGEAKGLGDAEHGDLE